MSFAELFILALGLSMDACAVAICKGACMREADRRQNVLIGLSFGLFQGLMPVLGWFLGSRLSKHIHQFDHWIAFGLLLVLGINTIRDALKQQEELVCTPLDARELLMLSVATSIDALAAGLALAVLGADIALSAITIGIVTAILSYLGVSLGVKFGQKYEQKAQLVGGTVLILIGARILMEHLGVW